MGRALPGNPSYPLPALPLAHPAARAPREPRPPPAAGARAPPSPRPVPKLGKLFNPFRVASVPWTQPLGRGSGGGLGAAAPWEVSGRFRNGGSGQAGTVWQLSGRPPESIGQSCSRHCARLDFRPRLPTSSFARVRSAGRRRGTGRGAAGCLGKGPGGDPGWEDFPSLTDPHPLTFGLCFRGEGGRGRPAPISATPART